MTSPAFAITDDERGAVLTAMPVSDQIEILERIVRCPPDRATQRWATRRFLDLTDPKTEADFL